MEGQEEIRRLASAVEAGVVNGSIEHPLNDREVLSYVGRDKITSNEMNDLLKVSKNVSQLEFPEIDTSNIPEELKSKAIDHQRKAIEAIRRANGISVATSAPKMTVDQDFLNSMMNRKEDDFYNEETDNVKVATDEQLEHDNQIDMEFESVKSNNTVQLSVPLVDTSEMGSFEPVNTKL